MGTFMPEAAIDVTLVLYQDSWDGKPPTGRDILRLLEHNKLRFYEITENATGKPIVGLYQVREEDQETSSNNNGPRNQEAPDVKSSSHEDTK